MSPARAVILTARDLPVAELSALRLDGEAWPLDEAMIPVDEPVLDEHRALALRALVDPRMVVERESALWVRGCLPRPPARHTVCLPRDHRARIVPGQRFAFRETNLAPEEIEVLHGLQVTAPARTLHDLALHEALSEESARGAVELLARHPEALCPALALTRAGEHTPGKRRALRRLREWEASSAGRSFSQQVF